MKDESMHSAACIMTLRKLHVAPSKAFFYALRAIKKAQKFQKQIEISAIVGLGHSKHLPAEHDVNM